MSLAYLYGFPFTLWPWTVLYGGDIRHRKGWGVRHLCCFQAVWSALMISPAASTMMIFGRDWSVPVTYVRYYVTDCLIIFWLTNPSMDSFWRVIWLEFLAVPGGNKHVWYWCNPILIQIRMRKQYYHPVANLILRIRLFPMGEGAYGQQSKISQNGRLEVKHSRYVK